MELHHATCELVNIISMWRLDMCNWVSVNTALVSLLVWLLCMENKIMYLGSQLYYCWLWRVKKPRSAMRQSFQQMSFTRPIFTTDMYLCVHPYHNFLVESVQGHSRRMQFLHTNIWLLAVICCVCPRTHQAEACVTLHKRLDWSEYILHWICSCVVTHILRKLNSVWPRDIIWRNRSGSTLAQVIACHYLKQCWHIICVVSGIYLRAMITWILKIHIPMSGFEFFTFGITASARGQWIKALEYIARSPSFICRIKTGHSNLVSCFGPRMKALAKVFYRGESRGKIPCQRPNPRAKT